MKELTLKYDEFGIYSDIENYLLTLKGIKNAKFDEDKMKCLSSMILI